MTSENVRAPRPLALPRPRALAARVKRPELGALIVLAAVLDFANLAGNGWANEYYSAAVRSMAGSWHNFLYGSFDPSGVMTVDKPPLALWIQTLSVKLFGYHPLSMLAPQALMGIATVVLAYDLTRRRFGRAAGFVAGLVLALTPVAVAVSRHNNPDALLVLCATAALWCLVRALEDGRTRWLVASGVCVGLGFEAKMAVALMVVPGIVAAWLWVAPRGRLAALRQLLAGGAAMVAVGGAWPLLVALTPASGRPWISGTSDNSILSLILGYNGFGRIAGQSGGPPGGGPGGAAGLPGGGGPFGGGSGPLRLLNESVGGQAGWLLGLALVSGIAVLVASRLRRGDRRTGWLIAVGGAFLTSAVAFSFAQGIFHPYYVSFLAPFTAALVGAGTAELSRRGRRARILAPLTIAAAVTTELVVIHGNSTDVGWLRAPLVLLGIVTAVALATSDHRRARAVALAVALAALLVAPAIWAADTLGHSASATFPSGGPQSAAFAAGPGGFGRRGFSGAPRLRGGFGGPPAGGFGTGGPPAGGFGGSAPRVGGFGPPPAAGTPPAGGLAGGPPAGGFGPPPGAVPGAGFGPPRGVPGGGGPFGGDSRTLTAAARYVTSHGGGTIGVSSQQGAAGAIIASGTKVAGIGGFSGRESDVSASWLAGEVRSGRISWVLTGGGGFGPRDGRVGATKAMAAVERACAAVPASHYTSGAASTGRGGFASQALYDCRGRAAALLAAARVATSRADALGA